MSSAATKRLLVIVTSATFVRVFLVDQLLYLSNRGYEVFLVCGLDEGYSQVREAMPDRVYGVSIARDIKPFADLWAWMRIVGLMVWIQPDIVHTHTPKAGLLGMAAARVTLIPNRIHTIHGLRSEILSGWQRWIVARVETGTVALATRVIAVSASLRREVIRRGIAESTQISVLGRGACSGVDVSVFTPCRSQKERMRFRNEHGIDERAVLIAYIGRIAADKGLAALGRAWLRIHDRNPQAFLVIAGPIDETNPVEPSVLKMFEDNPHVCYLPTFTSDVVRILAASDIAVQPSYREGLGMAALEASAMGLPVVASAVTGLVDAVIHQQTGLLVPARNEEALAGAAESLIRDEQLRVTMGTQGVRFVHEHFDHRVTRKNLLEFYSSMPEKRFSLKRLLDLTAAVVIGVTTIPLMIAAAVLILVDMGWPVLFRQERAGFRGRVFTLYKFRTMRAKKQNTEEQADAQRLTRLGRWLRTLSIDELPQLWNVLRGEMSLVGPRPLLVDYLGRYTKEQMRRHEVTPGITGWAQVHGRNTLSWEEKFAMDVWYVDHHSLALDLQILLLTIKSVCGMSGITPKGAESMPEFVGSQPTR